MGIFEHVSVFVSIILGLAVVHLLGGISLMLDARVRSRGYAVHLLWVINILFLTVLVWLGNFVLAPVEAVRVSHFLNLIAYCMAIYLMAGLLFPVRGGEITDFREYFHANRVRFCLVGIAFVLLDATDGVLEALALGPDFSLNPFQYGTLAVFFLVFAVGTRTANETFHRAGAIVFFLGMLGFLESLVRIGVVDA